MWSYLRSDQLLFRFHCAHADCCFQLLNSFCLISHKKYLLSINLVINYFFYLRCRCFYFFHAQFSTPSEFSLDNKNWTRKKFLIIPLHDNRECDHKSPVWRLPRDWSGVCLVKLTKPDRFNSNWNSSCGTRWAESTGAALEASRNLWIKDFMRIY